MIKPKEITHKIKLVIHQMYFDYNRNSFKTEFGARDHNNNSGHLERTYQNAKYHADKIRALTEGREDSGLIAIIDSQLASLQKLYDKFDQERST